METIIATLDQEISRLQQARAILVGGSTIAARIAATPAKVTVSSGSRHMSVEGRQRIIEAQKRRWAKVHAQVQ